MRDLCTTDPRLDKKRIQELGGGLLFDLYSWIIEHNDYQQFLQDPDKRVFWIRGDPGMGKTMLLCGIIDELRKETNYELSYFFCQRTDSNLNSATSVLRGLIYLLALEHPSLIDPIQLRYNRQGERLFQDHNAWPALKDIFMETVKSPDLQNIIILVDALDECASNRLELVDFIVQSISDAPRIKWIVTSRYRLDIEEAINSINHPTILQLEFNQHLVSLAVASYVTYKVDQLAVRKGFNTNSQDKIKRYLLENANGTFLWVSLVCDKLARVEHWNAAKVLESVPPGLYSFYSRMVEDVRQSDDLIICMQILGTVSLLFKPVSVQELSVLLSWGDGVSREEDVRKVIGLCGSFLTIRGNRVYFVHQSAKDFLLESAYSEIYPSGTNQLHYNIFIKCLDVLMRTLRRDIYGLQHPGARIDQKAIPDPDPLASVKYSCLHWVDHMLQVDNVRLILDKTDLLQGGKIDCFIQKFYLYWLEAISLLQSIPAGIRMISELTAIMVSCKHLFLSVLFYPKKINTEKSQQQLHLRIYCQMQVVFCSISNLL